MSEINIRRAVHNIRANTTVYTPVIEMIVNAIQAIVETDERHGKITITVIREDELPLDEAESNIKGIVIEDNGVGFTELHRKSFDTLYSDMKLEVGGKGFGRFVALKYFGEVKYESFYRADETIRCRIFRMGTARSIIEDERDSESESLDTGTKVYLNHLHSGRQFEKRLSTIAKSIVEKILPYFIDNDFICPEIILQEQDGEDKIILNNFIGNSSSSPITEMPLKESSFTLTKSLSENP